MINVLDRSGKQTGFYKNNLGVLVYNDKDAYNQYIKFKQQSDKIHHLESEIKELKILVSTLIDSKSK